MRRALGLRFGALRPALGRLRTLLKPVKLGLEPVELAGHFQHGLVLLGHVALQPGNALLKAINPFV